MVGIFLRFSVRRGGHRRTQSALDEREVLPPNADVTGTAAGTAAAPHGIEVTVQFKPVEHPIEPLKFSTMTNQFSARFLNLEFLMMEDYGRSGYLQLCIEEVTCLS
uniref:Uncharacterized protein n=1 Tax=Populus davidiana TaxID=266767 RepID=A0A6M2EAS1_9ROSI